MVKQKDKKAEKSKIKLKTSLKSKTKFLPKGGNVTDTNFKVRPIVIREQLKAKDHSQPLSARKLTFRELLTRLNHHNINVRYDGCNGLLELISASSQDVVEMQLHALLLGISKLFLDGESKVRRISFKLLTELLTKVSNVRLTPFFEVLISYTACAMTHLDINIQEDSLLVIDAYLNHIPILITKYHRRLFPNFLTLISKLQNESTSRALITDLRSSATSIKWRIKVLHRLRGILKAITKDNSPKEAPAITTFLKGASHFPLYKTIRKYPTDFLRQDERSAASNDLTEHIDVLLPLLYETWAEALQVKRKYGDQSTLIDYDTAAILSCSLGIFHLLWEYTNKIEKRQNRRFLTKANQKFFNHALCFFPYQQKQSIGSEQVSLDLNIEPKLIRENLLICLMFCTLLKDLCKVELFQAKTDVVSQYLKSCLINRNYIKSSEVPILLSSLRLIFFDGYSTWSQCYLDFEELLASITHFYKFNRLGNEVNVEVFKLLSDMSHLPLAKAASPYGHWMRAAPSLLCKPQISIDVLNCVSRLSRQYDTNFFESVRANFRGILGNITKIEVVGDDGYPANLKILHVLNVLESFTEDELSYLRTYATQCQDEDVKLSLLNIIEDKENVLL